MSVDPIDRRILSELQINGTLSQAELAEKVGASPSACWRRVKALEASGVLGSIVRLVNPTTIGLSVIVLCHVRLKDHRPETTQSFEALLGSRPEILECYAMSGDWDYFLRIIAADVASYESFLRKYLLASTSVGATNSNFALSARKYTTALPL